MMSSFQGRDCVVLVVASGSMAVKHRHREHHRHLFIRRKESDVVRGGGGGENSKGREEVIFWEGGRSAFAGAGADVCWWNHSTTSSFRTRQISASDSDLLNVTAALRARAFGVYPEDRSELARERHRQMQTKNEAEAMFERLR